MGFGSEILSERDSAQNWVVGLKDEVKYGRIWEKTAVFSQNSVIFNRIELSDYLSYTCDQVVKSHLFYQENRLARTIFARAARGRSAYMLKIIKK